ncbi:LysR substrate-binding domain-containing protein [Pelomonas aquatica]|jgi:LysR family glycine cleavage system transcriptional activator|uniref:LysR family transcriptional regulator n=1 Tax=Pelomonas aquatica TaxID=431058 RepID=A0A9X4LI48_9BURK|nr:LysR substrate-binding domain-containing protein [Pelomonas aquatica]MCY4753939.1 LysR substrate-binding domain-containing protein [Pelomonas aquatica]MDG0861265.1 LysR family transcriptional regulator [Pelomonas aquatica]
MPARPIRLPSLDALLAFEAVARAGSFEAAAAELALTASAVAKRVAGLEERLDQPLFLRQPPRGPSLTPAGHEYLPQVRQALALLQAMPLHQRASPLRERLRVSSTPTFARQLLVPALPAFTAAHPQVELELTLSVPLLAEGDAGADVEIRHGAVPDEIAPEQVLLRDRLTPLAAPALLARFAPLREPADLPALPLLRTPLQPWAPWLRAAGLADVPEPDEGPRLVDLGLTLAAALAGQGVALARLSLARHELAEGRLVQPFALTVPAERHYGLVTHRPGNASDAFAGWLHGHCRALEAENSSAAG